MPMVTTTKENGKIMKRMDLALILLKTVPFKMDNGRRTDNMARARRLGTMALSSKASTSMARKKEKAPIFGQMELHTQENSAPMSFTATEPSAVPMGRSTMATGKKGKSMDKVP